MRSGAYLLIGFLTVGMCGCTSLSPQQASTHAPISQSTNTKSQLAQNTRNNCYSLLYQLLSEEKDVSKILIIKHESRELNRFIKQVAKTSGDATVRLEQFRTIDPSLVLDAPQLPPGEVATRDAIAHTKTKALLGNSGNAFERALLITQIEALNYAAHLAKVGAEHDTDSGRSEYMQSLSQTMNRLYLEAVELLTSESRNH